MQGLFLRFIFILCCGSGFALGLPGFAEANPGKPPNIILILADDLGFETLNCNGGASYDTPNLDKLAASGMRFENAFAMPLCTPSRVQLMTGKYNFRNYIRFEYLDPKEKTFANYLRDAGYKTCVAGKWQLSGDIQTPGHFGFDRYCLWQLDRKGYFTRYKNPVIVQDGKLLSLPEDDYGEDVFTRYIKTFISENRKNPFLVYYPMVLPHAPFQPVPGHPDYHTAEEKVDDVKYFKAMVEHLDEKIGELDRFLTEQGLRENTVILFLGDNGTDTRITSQWRGTAVTGRKGYATLAGTHVPLLVSWPAVVKPGQVNDGLIDLTDFLPTLMSVAGVSQPQGETIDGVSFHDVLAGRKVSTRDWIYCEYDAKGRDFPTARYVQDKQYKLYPDGAFFDFIDDPDEKVPLKTDQLPLSAKAAYKKLAKVLKAYPALNEVMPHRGTR